MSDVASAETRIRQALLVFVTAWVDMLPDGPPPKRAGIIGRSPDRADPISAGLLDIRRNALMTLDHLTGTVLVRRRLTTCVDNGDAVAMAAFLTIHAQWLAEHEPTAGPALTGHANKIKGVVEPPGSAEFVGRCEVCDGDLRARDREAATCRDCGTMVDTATWREAATEEAQDRLLTAAEIVALAPRMWDHPVTHVHLSRWAKRSELIPHAHTFGPDPRPMYRVGDVRELVTRHAGRKRA